MQIIEEGFLRPRQFKCPHCGCMFIADMREYQEFGENRLIVKCPCCASNMGINIEDAPIKVID